MPRQIIAVLLVAIATASDALAQTTAIEGAVRAVETGAPIAFALVRLLPADTGARSGTRMQGITNAEGHYRFSGVSAGQYRVQLLRIGYQPVLSAAVQVTAGTTAQLPLRVESRPLELPAVIVRAADCVTGDLLAGHAQLLTFWVQARGGASIREGFMDRFRYNVVSREEGRVVEANVQVPSPESGLVEQKWVSDPRFASRNAARRRSERLSRGYYGPSRGGNDGWYLPNELDILHEEFLKGHCLETAIERGEGEMGLRFRPVRVRRDFLAVRGTIWLDSATYLAKRIDLEYVDGVESRGTVRLDFADVDVAGARLRMPVGGAYNDLRPSRKNPARRSEGKLWFTYSDFVEVPLR